ncbi:MULTISPECIES: YceI family protein [unclassified Pseudomonas]|jgi:polyisoprenoid-binding protein YceI|uniref:YceI family protein n=1 Tax=unclassified Pseudomonas TaxID=196821 RepID=UPI00069E972E|nr:MULTISPECIES: YceI family protein [unclassified Pseudomonas]WPN45330.1 YceI family protein [Pseudomonas sp. P8_241]
MNPRILRFVALAGVATLGVVPRADAVEYTAVNNTASTISFTYQQMGSKVYGTFGKFEGQIEFDTQNPAVAHAALTIDLASIDIDSSDAKTELQKPAWFDTQNFPKAVFESTAIQDLGNDRYTFTGNLTLRGQTRQVIVPVVLKSENAIGIFDGELILKRDDFKMGEGEWADSMVSNDINIRFRMVAPQR